MHFVAHLRVLHAIQARSWEITLNVLTSPTLNHRAVDDLVSVIIFNATIALGEERGRGGFPLAEQAGNTQPRRGTQKAEDQNLRGPPGRPCSTAESRAPLHDLNVQCIERRADDTAQEADDHAKENRPVGCVTAAGADLDLVFQNCSCTPC